MSATGIYCVKNRANGKRYVGSASKSLALRMRQHWTYLRAGTHYNQHLQAAWNKYGARVFIFQVLEHCSPDECLDREQHWIDELKAADRRYGYNGRPRASSNRGVVFGPEARARMSAGARRRLSRPGEKERLAEAGRKAVSTTEGRAKCGTAFKGKTHTAEARAKIGAASRTRVRSKKPKPPRPTKEETSARISAAMRGRVDSKETRLRKAAAQVRRWDDPERRARQSAILKAAWERRRANVL